MRSQGHRVDLMLSAGLLIGMTVCQPVETVTAGRSPALRSATSRAAGEAGVPETGPSMRVPRPIELVPESRHATESPTATARTSPEPNDSGWNQSAVTVLLSAVTPPGQLPVTHVVYSLSGAQTAPERAVEAQTVSLEVHAEGVTTVTYYTRDSTGQKTAPRSTTVQIDRSPPILRLPTSLLWEATGPAGAEITFEPRVTDRLDPQPTVSCSPRSGATFALGTTTVTCIGRDAAGNSSHAGFSVIVRDTTPPVIASIEPSVRELRPPDRRMVPVDITVSADDLVSGAPSCSVTGVRSSEAECDLCEGDLKPDWELPGGLLVRLRAERWEKGPGRTYTVAVRCVDAAGNKSVGAVAVAVPMKPDVKK